MSGSGLDREESAGRSALVRGALAVTVATLAVRLLGLVKESALGSAFGASAEMDALALALLLPTALATLLAGALPIALIPAYFAEKERSGEPAADRFFASASTAAFAVLALASSAISLAAPAVAAALAPESTPEKIARAASLLRALAFVLAASGLVAVLRSRLFAADRFFVGALGPAFVSAAVLAAVASGLARTVEGVAAALLAGYAAKAVFLSIALLRARVPLPIGLVRRGTGAGRFFAGTLPIVVGAGVVSLNGLVDQSIASRLPDGSVASLRFADQILQIPVALVAMAVSTACLPHFSRQASSGDVAGLRRSFSSAARSVLLVALPASAVLVAVPEAVVSLLFERGAFDAAATAAVAAPLRIYGLALPFVAYGYVNGRVYNALGQNGVLVKVALATLAANLVLDLLLVSPFGTSGIAAATVLSQGGAAVFLFFLLESRLGVLRDAEFGRSLVKGLSSAAALGALLALVSGGVPPSAAGRSLVVLGVAVPAAAALSFLFHRAEIASLVQALRRRA